MNKEEPVWKAELLASLSRLAEMSADSIMADGPELIEPHTRAAEERGRREGLRQAALVVRLEAKDWGGWPAKQAAMKYAAGLIDRTVVDPGSP